MDATERIQFLREMEQAREELAEFRRNMDGLLKQMDGIAVDLVKNETIFAFPLCITYLFIHIFSVRKSQKIEFVSEKNYSSETTYH